MDKKPTSKKFYVTTFTIKNANKILSEKSGKTYAVHRSNSTGQFLSRDELRAAFKTASRKLKSA